MTTLSPEDHEDIRQLLARDDFAMTADGWRFSSRHVTIDPA